MKIMFFCFADEMKVELVYWSKYFEHSQHKFIIAPLVRNKDKETCRNFILKTALISKNTRITPVYIRSQNSSFSNLLNPMILLNDFSSIFQTLNRSKPDVVFCYYVTHAYPIALLKSLFRYMLCIVAMGSDINLENNFIQKMTRKFVYRNCDRIFAVSWQLKQKIEKEQEKPVTVTPSSTDTSFFKPLNEKVALRRKWAIDVEKTAIVTVCKLDKNKAVDILLRSLKNLDCKDVLLIVAGDGPEQKALSRLAANLGVLERVIFLGFKNRNELLELYNLSDIFALASYSEGLPRVLIEAMSCGCVPIVTDVGSNSEVITNGFNGFLVPPGNPEIFSERINQFMAFTDEKKRVLRAQARQAVIGKFDTEIVLAKIIKEIDTFAI